MCLAIGDNQASFLGSIHCAKDEILVNFFQNCASAMGVDGFDPYSFMKKMLGVEELYNHKTLEERAKKFNGELNLDGEFQWGESVGREVW